MAGPGIDKAPESSAAAPSESGESKDLMDSVIDSALKQFEEKTEGITSKFNDIGKFFTDIYDQFTGAIKREVGGFIDAKAAASGGIFVTLKAIFDDVVGETKEATATAKEDPTVRTTELEPVAESEQASVLFLKEHGFNPTNLSELYPSLGAKVDRATYLQYCVWTVEASISMGLEPKKMLPLILTFMKIESGFNPAAKNASGATGLLQHMKGLWAERAKSLNGKHGFVAVPDISNSKAQICASLGLIASNITRVANNAKFGAAIYLTYNSGGAHAWIAKYNLMDKPDDVLKKLYDMSVSERVTMYPGSQTFKSYALARLTAGPPNVFDKAQSTYEKYYTKINGSAVS